MLTASLLVMCRTISDSALLPDPVGSPPRFLITKPGVYDGKAMGVLPGDTVAIQGGEYTYLRFRNFVGSPTQPIVLTNYRGQVHVYSTVAQLSNVTVASSRYIVLNGQGDPRVDFGFRIGAPAVGVSALAVGGKSSDVDMHHIEVDTAGFAGIMAKTDPAANDSSTWRGNFVMYNVSIHHNYVHNTRGEGLYIGNSFWNEGIASQKITLFPHEIVGLSIHHNRTERTGCEGIQYACAANSQVFHNQISQTGLSPFAEYQDNGVQIGGGVSGLFADNEIADAPGVGLIIVGHRGPLTIRNNLIRKVGRCGVFVDVRPGSIPGATLVFSNCTVDSGSKTAFRFYNRSQRNEVTRCAILSKLPFDITDGVAPAIDDTNFLGTGSVPAGIGYTKPD